MLNHRRRCSNFLLASRDGHCCEQLVSLKNDNPATSPGSQGSATGENGAQGSRDNSRNANANPVTPQPATGDFGADPEAAAGGKTPAASSVVANGNTVVRDPAGGVVVAGSTYAAGSTPQIAGVPLSMTPDHVVFGGSSYALPAAAPAAPILFGGQSIVKAQGGGVIDGGSTLAAGFQTVVAGHTVSVGSSHGRMAELPMIIPPFGARTMDWPATSKGDGVGAGISTMAPALGGRAYALPSTIAGASATIEGHIVSASSSAAQVDGTTHALPMGPGAVLQQAPNLAQELIAHSALILANGAVITAGGAPAVVDGTVLAIPSGDIGLVVNGKTIPLRALPLPTAAPSTVFTVAGQTFTAAPSGFAIGSQTLTSGGSAVSLAGTVVSLGPSWLEMGTSTIRLTLGEQSADAAALGELIMGGLAPNPTGSATNGSSVIPYMGVGSRLGLNIYFALGVGLGAVFVIMML